MKIEFKIIIIMMILVPATLFLIYQNPEESPKHASFEKYSHEILHINEKSKKYQLADDMMKFNASKILMQEKLKKISLYSMGLDISNVELIEGYYPFRDVQSVVERFDLEPSSICSFEQKIPIHLQILSQTKNFQMFTKKYSSHTLELSIMDERNALSSIHYGLIANNDKNQYASTYFHVDSCTDEITDKDPIFLNCFDNNNDYSFATRNYDDVISSYSNGDFCKIELEPWRQSIFKYSQILHEQRKLLHKESINEITDQETQWVFFSEMDRQGQLGNIVGNIVHGEFDSQITQEQIKEFEKQYGSLPDKLLELIEKRNEN